MSVILIESSSSSSLIKLLSKRADYLYSGALPKVNPDSKIMLGFETIFTGLSGYFSPTSIFVVYLKLSFVWRSIS